MSWNPVVQHSENTFVLIKYRLYYSIQMFLIFRNILIFLENILLDVGFYIEAPHCRWKLWIWLIFTTPFRPHCSHKILDVSVYGALKTYYRSQCNVWLKNNATKVLEMQHITGLVGKTLKLSLNQRNIMDGICPYNPDSFSDNEFVQAEQSGAKRTNAASSLMF